MTPSPGLSRNLVGASRLLQDERFKSPALRQKNINERLQLTQEALMTRSAAEWLERLNR